MTKDEQIKIVEELNSSNLEILNKKGNDYGSNQDVLINFKMVSGAAKSLKIDITTPEGYSLFMVLVKIARLTNLINSNKQVKNESIEDSFKDFINYAQLSYLNYLEKINNPVTGYIYRQNENN